MVLGAPLKHHAALPFDGLVAFFAAFRSEKNISALALEFAILTAARTGEVIGANGLSLTSWKRSGSCPVRG